MDWSDGYSIYSGKGDLNKAILDLNQAIIISPDYSEAYYDRGKVCVTKRNIDQAISDFNKAIKIDPYYSESYSARAEAYFLKQEYGKSWDDVHMVESFGDEVNSDFFGKLKSASIFRNIFLPLLILAPILMLLVFRFF